MKYKIIFLLLLSYGTTIGQSQLFKNNQLGISSSYNGSAIGLTLEACLNTSLTENLSLNLRYGHNSRFQQYIGAGLEYRFLTYKKFSASAGLEYSYSFDRGTQFFESVSNYGAIEVPLQLEYQVSKNFSLKGSFVLRTKQSSGARLGIFYKF